MERKQKKDSKWRKLPCTTPKPFEVIEQLIREGRESELRMIDLKPFALVIAQSNNERSSWLQLANKADLLTYVLRSDRNYIL